MKHEKKDDFTSNGTIETGANDTDNAQNINVMQQSSGQEGGISASGFSDKEIEYICQQITPRKIRAHFQQYPQEFAKIRPGIRAASLSDDMTIQFVSKNITKKFISSYINRQLSAWKREINECQKTLEEKGESHQKALLKTISQSAFSGNVSLFFKVTGESCSEEYVALAKETLQLLSEKEKQETNPAEILEREAEENAKNLEIRILQEKASDLSDQMVKLKQELETEKNAYSEMQKALSSLTERNVELESGLTTIKRQLKESEDRAERLQTELEKIQKLSKYSDEDAGERQSEDYQYTLIGQVFTNYNGEKWCRRLADIENRKVSRFMKVEEEPPYFSNRDKLPLYDGPDMEGFIGIWNWSAIPNYKDSCRDYVKMQYNSSIKYIEVVELTECHSCEELSDYLAVNTFPGIALGKILFVYRATEREMNGLLCGTRELEFYNGCVRLKKNVYILPQYKIEVGDVLEVAGKKIYRYLNMGIPQSVFQIKSPMEVVKNIIIKRATSARLRQGGLSVKETQHCQAFLRELPEKEIHQEIIDAYECTEKEAEEYLSAFVEQADSYLTESDIDMETLGAAAERNAALVKKCKELLSEDWKEENSEQLRIAQEELETLRRAAEKEKDIYISCKEQYCRMQGELEKFQTEISRQEKLAQEVEEKIAGRIAAARRDAAEFISEMAFAIPENIKGKAVLSEGFSDRISVTYRKKQYLWGDEITDMDSFAEELTDNLSKAGYKEDAASQMSQMIVFAICNKMPIVCGHHAERIADCVSAMFGGDGVCALTLPIGESRCKEICDFIGQEIISADRVFLLNGVFDGFSLNAFHEIRQRSEEWGHRAILIFSLNGVNAEMVSGYVWNRTMFIDGDIGIVDFEADTLNAFHSSVEFTLEYDGEDFRKKRRLLRRFYGIIDNAAILSYAKYLAVTDGTIEPEEMLLVQILLCAKSAGKKEKFLEILSSFDYDIKADKYIAKYL